MGSVTERCWGQGRCLGGTLGPHHISFPVCSCLRRPHLPPPAPATPAGLGSCWLSSVSPLGACLSHTGQVCLLRGPKPSMSQEDLDILQNPLWGDRFGNDDHIPLDLKPDQNLQETKV